MAKQREGPAHDLGGGPALENREQVRLEALRAERDSIDAVLAEQRRELGRHRLRIRLDRHLVCSRERREEPGERVVAAVTSAGYRWYETANFCLAGDRDLRSRHNLAYWRGRDYLGIGIGAVSTVDGIRWRNTPRLAVYLAAPAEPAAPPRDYEPLSEGTRREERVLLGLRLDEPLPLAGLGGAVDRHALARLERLRLARLTGDRDGEEKLTLTPRGRMLGGGVTAELLA